MTRFHSFLRLNTHTHTWRRNWQPTPVFLLGESHEHTHTHTHTHTLSLSLSLSLLFFIHSSVDGHLGCFSILTVINNACILLNVCFAFSIIYPGVGFLGHMVVLQFCFQFFEEPIVYQDSVFSISLPTFLCIIFDNSHSDR